MIEEKKVQPWIKTALEIGPVVLFFIAYSKIKDREFVVFGETYEGFIVATALFIPFILLATAVLYFLTGKLSKMQIFTAILVVVFGGLGIWFNDERFFKMKPTMIYLLFGGILGFFQFDSQTQLLTKRECKYYDYPT